MADNRIESEIRKEAERIKRILRAIPAPTNHHVPRNTVDRMFELAERRARITVLSRMEGSNNGQ